MADLTDLLVRENASVIDVMETIDRNATGVAVVADERRKLLGTITDGDIRRAILAKLDLFTPVSHLLDRRDIKRNPHTITAPVGTSHAELIRIMNDHTIRQIPLVDGEGRVRDVALLSELVKEYELPMTAVVMAGGFGKRLMPLTRDTPKPMLPVGDRPLLERIIGQLSECGVRRINLTTHYKKEIIEEYFGNGEGFGVHINYVAEDEPLGTAGSLCRLEPGDTPILVMNGDILTSVDFRNMFEFHREHAADLTIALKEFEIEIPYGVVETDGLIVSGISEKPRIKHFINAGIYLLNPNICGMVPKNTSFDIPDLIKLVIEKRGTVVGFPIREYWLDIGNVENYEQANADSAVSACRGNGL